MTVIDDLFQGLLYGAGSWIGLLIYLTLIIGLLLWWDKAAVLVLPITVLIGLVYFENDLGWHALIMWFTSIFIIFQAIKKGTK